MHRLGYLCNFEEKKAILFWISKKNDYICTQL